MRYKFNDFPFNMMSWVNKNEIEAVFHVGNPKQGDTVIYGTREFKIVSYAYKHDLYFLQVKKIES